MKIVMTKTTAGITREDGAETMKYLVGQEYEAKDGFLLKVLQGFVRMGVAHEIGGNDAPTETKKPRRARTAKGRLKADDPATPNVNEAWEGGKAPKK